MHILYALYFTNCPNFPTCISFLQCIPIYSQKQAAHNNSFTKKFVLSLQDRCGTQAARISAMFTMWSPKITGLLSLAMAWRGEEGRAVLVKVCNGQAGMWWAPLLLTSH